MIHFLGNIPNKVGVACSAGVDSMAVLNFLTRDKKREVYCLYYNHGTEHSKNTEKFIRDYCSQNRIQFFVEEYTGEQPKSNKEGFWRNLRYGFLKSFDFPVITCHHLDDCVESWIFSSLKDEGKLIPFKNENIIRPFLVTKKQDFIDWCTSKDVEWVDDPSNTSMDFDRNKIRHKLIPLAKEINPGIDKLIKKKLFKKFIESDVTF